MRKFFKCPKTGKKTPIKGLSHFEKFGADYDDQLNTLELKGYFINPTEEGFFCFKTAQDSCDFEHLRFKHLSKYQILGF
jgi:hypothetical protein